MFPLNLPNFLTVIRILLVPVLVVALLDKTGGDSLDEVKRNLQAYRDALAKY